jgi:imidazolonepropionase-like amidohydrolase
MNCRSAGVKIVLGTDAGSPGISWTKVSQAEELRQQVALGLSPLESIRTATIVAAELLGSEQAGDIRVGSRADLVGTLVDPIADVSVLEHIDFVMKDGKTVRWHS